jgi:hypothetical protein
VSLKRTYGSARKSYLACRAFLIRCELFRSNEAEELAQADVRPMQTSEVKLSKWIQQQLARGLGLPSHPLESPRPAEVEVPCPYASALGPSLARGSYQILQAPEVLTLC